MKVGKIELLDNEGQPKYQRQMSKFREEDDQNSQDSYSDNEESDEEEDNISPEHKSKTHLVRKIRLFIFEQGMKSQDFNKLEINVKDHIRRNSKKIIPPSF